MNETEELQVTTQNKPKKGEFYILMPDMRGGGRGHGVEFENEEDFPWPAHMDIGEESPGLKEFKQVPRLRQSRSRKMPNDLDASFRGYWLVSEPLKCVFESTDPEGFIFVPCDFRLYDGSKAPPHYLCEVVRVVDAIDEDASTVKVLTEGYENGKYYDMTGGASLAFKKSVVGSAHIFWTPYTAKAFCDRALRDALIGHGFGKAGDSRGVWLIDAADY